MYSTDASMMICCDADTIAKSFLKKIRFIVFDFVVLKCFCIPIAIIIQSCRAKKKNTEEFVFHTIRIYLGKTVDRFSSRVLLFVVAGYFIHSLFLRIALSISPHSFRHLTFHICRFIIWLCLSFHLPISCSHKYPHFYAKRKISWLSLSVRYGCHSRWLLAVECVSHP